MSCLFRTDRMLLECCIYRIKVRNIYCYAIWAVMRAMCYACVSPSTDDPGDRSHICTRTTQTYFSDGLWVSSGLRGLYILWSDNMFIPVLSAVRRQPTKLARPIDLELFVFLFAYAYAQTLSRLHKLNILHRLDRASSSSWMSYLLCVVSHCNVETQRNRWETL